MLLPRVLVFRAELLALSETFIQSQTSALRQWEARYIGIKQAKRSLPIPEGTILLTSRYGVTSKLIRAWYRATDIAPQFYRMAARWKPDLVHAHFANDGALALPLVGYLGVPLVVTLHGFDVTANDSAYTSYGARRLLARRPQLYEKASLFICVSEYIRRRALERGFPREKLLVHHIGIDVDTLVPGTMTPGREIILFVGRMVEKKGLRYLLGAVREVQRTRPSTDLVIIGDGPLRTTLEAYAMELGVRGRFIGSQSHHSVVKWMQKAMMLVVPSVTAANGDSEGLPIALLEAQALGLPTIASRHAGIEEAITHGATGLLVDERDEAGLASAIDSLIGSPVLRQSIADAGVLSVRSQFNLRVQTDSLEEIYHDVITRKRVTIPGPLGA